MSDRNQSNLEDLLEASLAAMRDQPIPSGPSVRTIADTLSALRGAEERPKLWQRVLTMTLSQKIAAAVAMTIGGLTIYFILSLSGGFASISYAQVADQIRAVRSMTCTITAVHDSQSKPITMRAMFMNPDKTRMEMPGGNVVIVDGKSHRSVMLIPLNTTAVVTDIAMTNPPARPAASQRQDFIAEFKNLANGKGEPVPDRQIGSIKAKGFHVQDDGIDGIVYANPQSGMPIEVDFDKMAGATRVVMGDFNFDANLTADLFDLTPPQGYTIQNQKVTLNGDLAANIVPVLRAYATHKNGQFPPQLNDWADIIKTLQPGPKADESMKGVFMNMGAVTGMLSHYHRGTEWDYLPDGIKLGDADKVVFWYSPTRESTTSRAVYGDLRIADVTANQLPPHQSR